MKKLLFKILFGALSDFIRTFWEDLQNANADNKPLWDAAVREMRALVKSGLDDDEKRKAVTRAILALAVELGADIRVSLANAIVEVALRTVKREG